MPFYKATLDAMSRTDRRRTTGRLLELRDALDMAIPRKDADGTLLVGTWNIREFDAPAYGPRLPEAMLYIAEIVNRFDLIAIQEVRGNLTALMTLTDLLGSRWRYLFSDVTEGRPGNDERLAVLYDSRKVQHKGLAGELVLPEVVIEEGGKTIRKPVEQIARTPFMAGFQAGWTRFILTTVHIVYGESRAVDPRRLREIQQVARLLKKRASHRDSWSRNFVLLGDFNIFANTDETMKAITNEGFVIPPRLLEIPGSNVAKNKHYDQIAINPRPGSFDLATPTHPEASGGVFDYYRTVFTNDDQETYRRQMGAGYETNSRGRPRPATGRGSKESYYRTYWRTHQMSDHLPMWTRLKIDYSNDYLARRRDE